ncbi:MAG: TonB-dependent receptor, partial [Muribaculaceae bacterium]|nr:TonB-dependent receptor [Muribaculaceae bacterium]
VYSFSANDYTYTNHDKKLNIYDDDRNIIGQYYPREHNRNGAYHDLHILQEASYNTLHGDRISLSAWYIDSSRELPLLTTDYTEATRYENYQREHTIRAIVNWNHTRSRWKTMVSGGYIHTSMAYDYSRETAAGATMAAMTRSRSHVNTFHVYADGEFMPTRRWLLTASLSADQHTVLSHDKTVTSTDGNNRRIGYDVGQFETSAALSIKWKPSERTGVSATLRKELYGTAWTPLIPALFAEFVVDPRSGLIVKASVIRNHRYPSLNDLYFMPGGNPDLNSEHGISYDCSLDIPAKNITDNWKAGISVTWFDSHIDDWIIWLPTTKGFFSPRNMKKVHAYGIEATAHTDVTLWRDWLLNINGSMSWTPSVNEGDRMSEADISVGKQLPYVPRRSASMTASLRWRTWSVLYKWCHYSQRFTMSSNEATLTGKLPPYYMSNISVEKQLSFRPADLSLKLAVNNLFNEDYLSVLSHPMPGINFELFISITPRLTMGKPKTPII